MGNRRVALVQLVTSDSVLKVKKGFGKCKKKLNQEPRTRSQDFPKTEDYWVFIFSSQIHS